MRTVTLKVKAKIMVPLVVEYLATVKVDEGKPMGPVASAVLSGQIPDYMDIDDSSIVKMTIEGDQTDPADSLEDQIDSYIAEEIAVKPVMIGYEVEDSR